VKKSLFGAGAWAISPCGSGTQYDRNRGVPLQAFDRPKMDFVLFLFPTVGFLDYGERPAQNVNTLALPLLARGLSTEHTVKIPPGDHPDQSARVMPVEHRQETPSMFVHLVES
jgi:hypothetical protein